MQTSSQLMDEATREECLSLCVSIARQAAQIALRRVGTARVSKKADKSVVTEVDHEIQSVILDAVARRFPGHAVIAEEEITRPERHADRNTASICWIVDPLDGTRNYVSGYPCFATSIAVVEHGRPIIGVVHEHNTDLMYTAVQGGGAKLQGALLRPNFQSQDNLMIGIPSTKDRITVELLRHWAATRGIILRNCGSTALHLAMTAAGQLDAAFCQPCKIWDIAAGVLLVDECGKLATAPDGVACAPFVVTGDVERYTPFFAAGREVYDRLFPDVKAALAAQVDTGQP